MTLVAGPSALAPPKAEFFLPVVEIARSEIMLDWWNKVVFVSFILSNIKLVHDRAIVFSHLSIASKAHSKHRNRTINSICMANDNKKNKHYTM